MAKYLFQSTGTVEGFQGIIKEGGTARRAAVEEFVKAMGGTLEALYFAFGETDVFTLVDLPDNVSASAVALVGNASGGSTVKTTVLITPEEVDQATNMAKKLGSAYRPPGE